MVSLSVQGMVSMRVQGIHQFMTCMDGSQSPDRLNGRRLLGPGWSLTDIKVHWCASSMAS